MRIETNTEIAAKFVGRRNSEITDEMGSFYPVLGEDHDTVIGLYSAEYGAPDGYVFDERRDAYVIDERSRGDIDSYVIDLRTGEEIKKEGE